MTKMTIYAKGTFKIVDNSAIADSCQSTKLATITRLYFDRINVRFSLNFRYLLSLDMKMNRYEFCRTLVAPIDFKKTQFAPINFDERFSQFSFGYQLKNWVAKKTCTHRL